MYFSTYTSALPNAGKCLGLGHDERGCELRFFKDHPHALAPAPATAFMMTGKPSSRARDRASASSVMTPGLPQDRHTRLLCSLARLGLVTHELDAVRARPDELDAGRIADLGEARILGQEPISRVDRLGVCGSRPH